MREQRHHERAGSGQHPVLYRTKLEGTKGADPEAEALLWLIANHRKVPRRLLLHASRCRAPVASARQLAMYLMHVALGRSLTEVGSFFGRDRTTVSHACAMLEDRRDERGFEEEVSMLERRLTEMISPRENSCTERSHG